MKASPRCATYCAAGTRSLRGRRARGNRVCSMPSSPVSSCVWARSARSGGPANTPPRPQSWCPLPASVTSSIRPASAKSAPGASIPTSWARAFRNSGPISINAASTTAGTSRSRAAPCVVRQPGPSIPIGWCPTSGSTKRSASLPGPAAGVAGGDLGHHLRERLIEVDALGVGQADHDEQDVRQLHRDRADVLVRLLALRSEVVIDLARQLANFLGEAGDVGERREVAFLILADPAVDGVLRFAKAHGIL